MPSSRSFQYKLPDFQRPKIRVSSDAIKQVNRQPRLVKSHSCQHGVNGARGIEFASEQNRLARAADEGRRQPSLFGDFKLSLEPCGRAVTGAASCDRQMRAKSPPP